MSKANDPVDLTLLLSGNTVHVANAISLLVELYNLESVIGMHRPPPTTPATSNPEGNVHKHEINAGGSFPRVLTTILDNVPENRLTIRIVYKTFSMKRANAT